MCVSSVCDTMSCIFRDAPFFMPSTAAARQRSSCPPAEFCKSSPVALHHAVSADAGGHRLTSGQVVGTLEPLLRGSAMAEEVLTPLHITLYCDSGACTVQPKSLLFVGLMQRDAWCLLLIPVVACMAAGDSSCPVFDGPASKSNASGAVVRHRWHQSCQCCCVVCLPV